MSVRVVLDTSVVVAGLRSQGGASRLWLEAALTKRHIVVVSVPLMVEYEAVTLRPEHVAASRLSADEIRSFLDHLCGTAERVVLQYRIKPILADPADEMVLETAILSGADAIVTFNVRDFVGAAGLKMPILTPAQAWTTYSV